MNKLIPLLIAGIVLVVGGVTATDIYDPLGLNTSGSVSAVSENGTVGVQEKEVSSTNNEDMGDNMTNEELKDIISDPKKAIAYYDKTGKDVVVVDGEPVFISKETGDPSEGKVKVN